MRKKVINRIIAFFLVMTFLLSPMGSAEAVKAANTATAAKGDYSATAIVSDISVGWNLGNSMDSHWTGNTPGKDANLKDETIWGNPKVTKELITYVKKSGFNAIRIPVTWYMNSGRDSKGNLVVGEKWMARVKEIVDYAISNDMYVIIDSHHDYSLFKIGITDEKSYKKTKNDFKSLWTQVAKTFKNYDSRLMFESFNEIYSANDKYKDPRRCDEFAMKQYNELTQLFVDTVRNTGGNNKKRVLVLGCPLDAGSEHVLSMIKRPKDNAKDALIFDSHFYTGACDQSVEYKFNDYKSFTEKTNIPVIIGETGTTNSYEPKDFRTRVATNFVARAAAKGIKIFVWDNGSDYAIINRKNLKESNTEMIKAYMAGLKEDAEFENKGFVELNKKNSWVYKRIDPNNGNVIIHNGWGFLTNDDNSGKGIVIPEGVDYVMTSLSRRGAAWETEYAFVAFYDKNGKFISSVDKRAAAYREAVPSGAKYFKVTVYNAFVKVSQETFMSYLEKGELKVLVSFVGKGMPAGTSKGISSKKPVISKIKRIKGTSAKIYIKKIKIASGYRVEISSSKSFKKKKVVNSTKNTITVKKLKKKKKYYVRVRAYTKDKNGKKKYSKYSKVKMLK